LLDTMQQAQYQTQSFQYTGPSRQSSKGTRNPQMMAGRAGPGAPPAASFQNAASFNFFQVPPGMTPGKAPAGQGSSFPQLQAMAPQPSELQHCDSHASYASNDAQEELNLHPSLNRLKKNSPFEADANSILSAAMGGVLASGMPTGWMDQRAAASSRAPYNLQKTESQLIQAQAQALLMQEKRRRDLDQAAARKLPSPIRALLDARPYTQKIFLMRHGESEANISRRDVPDPNLTKLGLAQAKSWQECIGDFEPTVVMVSPLCRAVQTACHAFAYEEVPMIFCRFAREIGWCCNENTIHSTPAAMEAMLEELPRGEDLHGIEHALIPAADDPPDEISSLHRLKIEIARRPEQNIFVVCHFGIIATLTGNRAKNGDIYECEWSYNDELTVIQRHKTPLSDQNCVCG